jgi:peptidoglycan/xylan/chitin deacetylase (PgdA/CDA1 family)
MRNATRDAREWLARLGGRRAGPVLALALAVVLAAVGVDLVTGLAPGASDGVATASSTAGPSLAADFALTEPPPLAAPQPVPSAWLEPPTPPPTEAPTELPPTPAPTAAPTPVFTLHVPILTYHVIAPWSVASSYSQPELDVDPAVFDAQLALLQSKGWHSITVDRLYRYLAAKQRPPRRTFVITIDDGHDDGYTYALPILQKHGFVATYYVVAGRVDRLDNLTWEQISTLAADGMEIGNHTLNHLGLTSLGAAEVADQVTTAEQLLTDHLGSAPTTFAYPFGEYDLTAIGAVRAAGLKMAVTTRDGASETWLSRYRTGRIAVYAGVTARGLLSMLDPFA